MASVESEGAGVAVSARAGALTDGCGAGAGKAAVRTVVVAGGPLVTTARTRRGGEPSAGRRTDRGRSATRAPASREPARAVGTTGGGCVAGGRALCAPSCGVTRSAARGGGRP
jgi:hypothetical protein